jgi:hypothetical protein
MLCLPTASRLPTGRSGDFGTSPFFRQRFGQAITCPCLSRWDAKSKQQGPFKRLRIYTCHRSNAVVVVAKVPQSTKFEFVLNLPRGSGAPAVTTRSHREPCRDNGWSVSMTLASAAKPSPLTRPASKQGPYHGLEHIAQDIAVAEAAVAIGRPECDFLACLDLNGFCDFASTAERAGNVGCELFCSDSGRTKA